MTTLAVKPRYRVKAGSGEVALIAGGGGGFQAARHDTPELAGWAPGSRSADADVLPARDMVTRRVRDLDRNNGWANAGVERRVDTVVGANLWLEAQPNYTALGLTADWAAEWAINTEAQFSAWANDDRCDVERHLQFGGNIRLAYTHYVREDEACAALYLLERGAPFATAFKIIDPDRLSNPHGAPDSDTLRDGVQLDANEAAIGYHVRVQHPNDVGTQGFDRFRWEYIPRESVLGRPLFVHAYNKRRAGQRRGISRFAAAIKRLKMLEKYDDTTLQAAVLNAVLAAVVESPFDTDQVEKAVAPIDENSLSAYQEGRVDFHEKSNVTLGGVQLTHLYHGEKLNFNRPVQPGETFVPFEAAVLRSIAAALGLTYEQLSGDWSQVNYSSARAALIEIWRGFIADRRLFTQRFCTPIYSAWLEEAIARGIVKVPGGIRAFWRNRSAFTQCDWVGPGRGFVDPDKEQKASAGKVASLLSTNADEAAEQGKDWRKIYFQRAREIKEAERLGIPAPQPAAPGPAERDEPDEPAAAKRK